MNINEVLYLPVRREGLRSDTNGECWHNYRTLDGEEVASSFKAKSEEELVDQIKPEIPEFVADWIKKYKDGRNSFYSTYLIHNVELFEVETAYNDNCKADDPFFSDIVAEAWINGYTIEKEKLYTVDLPNGQPLVRGINTLYFSQNLATENVKLTESEIRKDFDWAWQFAEEVTE